MNVPNRLTIARTILIPFYLVFLMVDFGFKGSNFIAAAIFIVASFTDFLDGKLARKYGQVTNFGKFMDPLADKLLVCSALIAFIELGRLPAWIVIIIIAREFIISGFRLVASDAGIVIAASMWGKIKTTVQMIMIITLTLNFDVPFINVIEIILVYASLALTLISLADYLIKNRKVITNGESGCK
ncbi:MAG: CDP-diacylglycerol--glycerol-3-phosphate 3-phosphatidyltransferase [Lachnospiraceae bacterium]